MNVSILIKNLILFVCFVDLISTQEYNVRDFGAIGDGVTNDTKAVRDAWAAAAKTNGGRVIFDAGYNFLTAPFNLTTNGILDVRGTITASRNRSDYYPIPKEPWWGNYNTLHPIVFAYNATNVTITGGGVIYGQGQYWYDCSAKNRSAYPCEGFVGPKLVKMIHTTDIVIENITLLNSPRWSCTLSYSTNVYINHVNITAPYELMVLDNYGMSNDGIDLDCCVNVTIDDYYYIGGDDAIMVKAGYGVPGQTYGRTSENITVRNARIDYSGGIGVGVEIAAGARNVTYRDIIMNNSIKGIKVQSERMMGGFIEDISFYNVTLLNMIHPFMFTLDYNHHVSGTSNTPKWKNVFLDNIVSDNSTYTWVMQGTPESWLQNLVLGRINITNIQRDYVASCYNVTGMCNNATIIPYCPACIKEETTCECPSGNWYQSSANPCNCFNFVQTPKTWPMANADCQQQNPKATLASIDSAFQNNDLWTALNNQTSCSQIFIGLEQNNNAWTWNNNDSSAYRNWRSGYPVGGSAIYAELNKNDGKWTNIIGSVTGCYVCEIKNE